MRAGVAMTVSLFCACGRSQMAVVSFIETADLSECVNVCAQFFESCGWLQGERDWSCPTCVQREAVEGRPSVTALWRGRDGDRRYCYCRGPVRKSWEWGAGSVFACPQCGLRVKCVMPEKGESHGELQD